MSETTWHRRVRLTARTSGLLFAGSQATAALGAPTARAARPLYLAFMAAHAAHFAAVSRYAVLNEGRDLFPGGRSIDSVGGWPSVFGIFGAFGALALTGASSAAPLSSTQRPQLRGLGPIASAIIATMYVSTYIGQLNKSRWYAVPAVAIGAAATANLWRQTKVD